MASRRTTVPAQVLAVMKLVLALMLGAAAAFAPSGTSRASTSLSVGPVGEQKLTTKGPSSKRGLRVNIFFVSGSRRARRHRRDASKRSTPSPRRVDARRFSMDNQYAMGHMGKYDDAATEDERSQKFLARHDGDVGAELGSLQVRTPERVAAEIAQIKADRQARVRRAKKLN